MKPRICVHSPLVSLAVLVLACSTGRDTQKESIAPTERVERIPSDRQLDDSLDAMAGVYRIRSYERFEPDCRDEGRPVAGAPRYMRIQAGEGPEDEAILEVVPCESLDACRRGERPEGNDVDGPELFWKAAEFGWENVRPLASAEENYSQCRMTLFEATLVPLVAPIDDQRDGRDASSNETENANETDGPNRDAESPSRVVQIERAGFEGRIALEGDMACVPWQVDAYRDALECQRREVIVASPVE